DVARLRQSLAALRATERATTAQAADPSVTERLRALGYVAAPPPAAADEAGLRDPKDALTAYRACEAAPWADLRGEHEAHLRAMRGLVEREPQNAVFRRTLAAA